jgi:hypothetical protein
MRRFPRALALTLLLVACGSSRSGKGSHPQADGGPGNDASMMLHDGGPAHGGETCRVFGDPVCGQNEYCLFDLACGHDDKNGQCAPKPGDCADNWEPVCGCNLITYGNACKAAAAGMSVRMYESCWGDEHDAGHPPDGGSLVDAGAHDAGTPVDASVERDAGQPLPCTASDGGTSCPPLHYCYFELAQACGANAAVGECRKLPMICPNIIHQICGCDNQTYNNACLAERHGVSESHEGVCEMPPPPPRTTAGTSL